MIDEKLQETIDRSEILNLISKSIITRASGFWDQLAEYYQLSAGAPRTMAGEKTGVSDRRQNS
jgi:hypothetical protein